MNDALRHDWTTAEILDLFALPFGELAFRAQQVHREHFPDGQVQLATLTNIKRGGCPEDCGYCSQSAFSKTGMRPERMAELDEVMAQARRARDAGATRFCMGAAWREVRDGPDFDRVVDMVQGVAGLGMEVCTTLGMLDRDQADRLARAGLTAYNHNIDTSPEHYGNVTTTRTFRDRLDTLQVVRDAGLQVCCGGIVGLGETLEDRAGMLQVLACMEPHPESVPINQLVAVPGTSMEDNESLEVLDYLRVIAVARILMP
ncbi:MAG: biotin synthase BioB, partial [Myxococcota bacterium]|nr:biotin synthase BioB [Myxococcota bacterium]